MFRVELLESGERSAVQLGRELGVWDSYLGESKHQYGRHVRFSKKKKFKPKPDPSTTDVIGGGQSPTRHFKKSLGRLRPGTRQLYKVTETLHHAPDFYSRAKELCLWAQSQRAL